MAAMLAIASAPWQICRGDSVQYSKVYTDSTGGGAATIELPKFNNAFGNLTSVTITGEINLRAGTASIVVNNGAVGGTCGMDSGDVYFLNLTDGAGIFNGEYGVLVTNVYVPPRGSVEIFSPALSSTNSVHYGITGASQNAWSGSGPDPGSISFTWSHNWSLHTGLYDCSLSGVTIQRHPGITDFTLTLSYEYTSGTNRNFSITTLLTGNQLSVGWASIPLLNYQVQVNTNVSDLRQSRRLVNCEPLKAD
jgi:hypothetical protein